MIEILILVVAFIVVGAAFCGIMCAICHCVPVLCLALGLGASTWSDYRRSRERDGGTYTAIQGGQGVRNPQNTDLVTADAYILPPLEVQDGVYVVTETASAMASETTSKEQYQDPPMISSVPDDSTHHIVYRGLLDLGLFKDTLAAVAFLLNCSVLVLLATRAIRLLGSVGDGYLQSSDSNNTKGTESEDTADDFRETMPAALGAYCMVALFATVLTCSVYLTLLMKYASRIISATIWGSIIFFVLVGVLSLLNGAIIAALFSFVLSVLSYCWLQTAQPRIEFASVILKTAVSAVKDNFCSLISASLFLQLIQAMYILAWALAAGYWLYSSHDFSQSDSSSATSSPGRRLTGAVHMLFSLSQKHDHEQNPYPYRGGYTGGQHEISYSKEDDILPESGSDGGKDDEGGGFDGFVVFLFILSLYWGAQVFRNVVNSTVAGSLACWWFTPQRTAIVAGALFRAFTTSFGTICFGSLIVSLVQALRSFLNNARDRAQRARGERSAVALSCTLCVTTFLLQILEGALSFVNKYAFVYSASYGENFATSGGRVWELFKKRGWTAIIADSLIGNTLGLGVFATACVTSLFAYLTSFLFDQDLHNGGVEKPRLGLSVGGFVLGMVIGLLVSNIIESAVASVFVFFAEDPKELQNNHPEVHDQLCIAWMAMYPTSLNLDASGRHGALVTPSAIRIETVTGSEAYDPSPDSGIALSPSLQRQGVGLYANTPSAPMSPAQLPL